MFFVLEGIDGCGKETQVSMLKEKLKFDLFKFPTVRFREIDDHLHGRAQLAPHRLFDLFLTDICMEQGKLAASKFAVCDRYVFSTIAYAPPGISFESARSMVEAKKPLAPDLVAYIDITPEISQERKRAQKQLDRYEADLAYLGRVRDNYLKLARDNFIARKWLIIDGSGSRDDVHGKIMAALQPYL
jgi:dTMP kinase